MKVHMLVQREPGTTDCCWILDACDEYTMDEWNGSLPEPMQARIDADPANVGVLVVEIPDDAMERVFRARTVNGTVVEVAANGGTPHPDPHPAN